MAITTQKFVRKPLYVDAVQVTAENFMEMAFWCGGSIKNNDENNDSRPRVQGVDPANQHIKVQVQNPKNIRQTKAFVGDWILLSETESGVTFKIYTEKAFETNFDPATGEDMDQFHQQEKTQPEVETELVREPAEQQAQEAAETAQDQAQEAQQDVDEVKDDLQTPEHQPPSQEGSETVTENPTPADDTETQRSGDESTDPAEPQDAEPTDRRRLVG